MRKITNKIFTYLVCILTLLTVFLLAFVIYFVVLEAMPVFQEVGVSQFLFGQRWMPLQDAAQPSYGIFNFIAGTLYVAVIAMIFAVSISIGAAVYLSCVASEGTRKLLYACIDLLAGIPSVVYGFIGLMVLVKLFLNAGHRSGTSVLTGAILLAVMLLPFLVSSISDTMIKLRKQYMHSSDALGVSSWYMIAKLLLPLSAKSIFLNMILAVSRAMGETMTVMMVMGNANIFPRLLGKGETIASLIALEMGTAVAGSTHYHALYAAGLVLMILLWVINLVITSISKKIL